MRLFPLRDDFAPGSRNYFPMAKSDLPPPLVPFSDWCSAVSRYYRAVVAGLSLFPPLVSKPVQAPEPQEHNQLPPRLRVFFGFLARPASFSSSRHLARGHGYENQCWQSLCNSPGVFPVQYFRYKAPSTQSFVWNRIIIPALLYVAHFFSPNGPFVHQGQFLLGNVRISGLHSF